MLFRPRIADVDYSKLFILWSNLRWTQGLVVDLSDSRIDDLELFNGTFRPKTPVLFDYFSGSNSKPCDLVSSGFPGIKLISKRFREVLETGKFTGWRTYPALVRKKNSKTRDDLFGLSITGRCGRLHNEEVTPFWHDRIVPRGCRYQAWRGVQFDEGTWDGSDLFCSPEMGFTLLTDRVRQALIQANLSNVTFESLSELELSYSWRRDGSSVYGKQKD